MGIFSSNTQSRQLNWINIESIEDLKAAYTDTDNQTGLFFKHSTRCPTSRMVLNKFESEWEENEKCKLYYIDLLKHRDVSNTLSELSGVEHQSPQAILVQNKTSIYNNSHNRISANEIKDLI